MKTVARAVLALIGVAVAAALVWVGTRLDDAVEARRELQQRDRANEAVKGVDVGRDRDSALDWLCAAPGLAGTGLCGEPDGAGEAPGGSGEPTDGE